MRYFLLSIVYSFDGVLVFGLLFICTCAYFKKVPRLNSWLLSEKKGVWGVFYKGNSDIDNLLILHMISIHMMSSRTFLTYHFHL